MKAFVLWITWRDPMEGKSGIASPPYESRERCVTKELHPKESARSLWLDPITNEPIADFDIREIDWEPGVMGYFGNETRPRPYFPEDGK